MRTPPLEPGIELLDGYTVVEHLSRGRRLDVYDVWSDARGCRCVIKCLRPERAGEQRSQQLLLDEGGLLGRLTHPHLVRAYETISEPFVAVVLETLPGETLAHVVAERRRLSAVELGHLASHLGSAIRYLHAHRVLHLDLKPANVVADGGRAKLIDLSVARAPGQAKPGVGTPDFMAPEQARGGELGPAADVWGVGIVLHELVTGERAFGFTEEGSDEETDFSTGEGGESWGTGEQEGDEYLQLEQRAPALRERDDLEPELAALVDDCLQRDPELRPSVEQLLARAERIAGVPPAERRWG